MRHLLLSVLHLSALLVLLCPAGARAADRVALVLGMSDYRTIPALANAANDARLIGQTLSDIGFEVTTLIDAPSQSVFDALAAFAVSAETADLALIYFAGHGVEVQGRNYLIPADAEVRSNAEVARVSASLDDLLAAVDGARKMRIVILDSCRDNPFGDALPADTAASDGVGRGLAPAGGLAPPSPDRGTLVAFAAKDGQVALDGSGSNSPFARALAARLAEPGLEISLMFRQVRDLVLNETANRQEPHTYGSLSGVPFYLAGEPEDRERLAVDDRRLAWSALRPDAERQLAALAETGDTRSMLGLAYMRLNPDARDRFQPAEAAALLERAAAAGSPEAQYELAKLLEQGMGVDPDPARALDLYRQAAAQDFADAINDLGFLHYQGALGLPQDPDRALQLFERAADLRHPQAMFNFAALIDDGLVPGKGPDEAARYLYQAVRSGSRDVLALLTEQPTMFKQATRRALQGVLAENAFYEGGLDGQFGPGTQRGLRRAFGLED
jgi:TPR repeat protein